MVDLHAALHGPPDEPPPPLAEANGAALHRVDLAAIMRSPLRIPAPFRGLVYPAKLHTLSGPPEAGKTVLALWLAVQAMQLGHNVVMFDEESGTAHIADLLRSLGAEPDLVDAHFHLLPFLDLAWKGDDLLQHDDLIAAVQPKLAIYDSAAEMLSAAGLDENNPSDVTRFFRTVLRPVANRYRASVLLLDHDAKGEKQSRYARGSTAKLAVPDAALKLTQLRPFSREQDGIIGLMVAKDRLGAMHRHYRIQVTRQPLDLHFTKTTQAEQTEGGSGMSPAAEGLLSVLSEQPETSTRLVDKFAAKYGYGLKRETATRALSSLADMKLADQMHMGAGRASLWMRAKAQPQLADAPAERERDSGWPEGSVGAEVNQ